LRSATRWVLIAVVLMGMWGCTTLKGVVSAVEGWMEGADTGVRKRVVVAPVDCSAGVQKWVCNLLEAQLLKALRREGSLVTMGWAEVVGSRLKPTDPAAVSSLRQAGAVAVIQAVVSGIVLTQQLKGIYGFREMTPFVVLEVSLTLRDADNSSVLAHTLLRPEAQITEVQASAIRDGKAPPTKVVKALVAKAAVLARAWTARAMARVPWKGYVLKAQGSKVLISVGRDTGMGVGTELVAYTRGQGVRTGSGKIIHLPGKKTGRVRITKLMARSAWAEVVEGKVVVGEVLRTH